MPPSRPLQVAAALAGAGALVGAGVALGRGIGRGDEPAASLWPEEILTLRFGSLDLHRRAPGSYVARLGASSVVALPRAIKAPHLRLGTVTITATEWRVITGILEAAWCLLDAVPEGRNVHDLRLELQELPLESQWSLMLKRPLEIIRDVSDRTFCVIHESRPSTGVAHIPTWDRDRGHVASRGVELTRRQWILYTGILEAAWLVGETMDGSIGGGPQGEGRG